LGGEFRQDNFPDPCIPLPATDEIHVPIKLFAEAELTAAGAETLF